jgi:hypothetical protein
MRRAGQAMRRDSLHSREPARMVYQMPRNAIADYYRGRRCESLPDGIAAHEEEDEPARQGWLVPP